MSIFVISGCSSGIGLELAIQLLERGNTVVAACRTPFNNDNLKELQEKHGEDKLKLAVIDVTDEKKIKDCAATVGKWFDHIDVLVNNAGILYSPEFTGGGEWENTLTTGLESIRGSMDINFIGPLLVSQAFYPLLKKSARPIIANISTNRASNALNLPAPVSYCASKAAVNMLSTCQARDMKDDKVTVLSIHPGWVDTKMGRLGNMGKPDLSVFESATGVRTVIENAKLEQSGAYLSWEGDVMPF